MVSGTPKDWSLHPQLAQDTVPIGDLVLARVLLANDANFPWLILVPRRPGLVELIDLEETHRFSCWAKSPPQRARSNPSPNATSSTSPRSATRWRNCTCTSLHAGTATPPSPNRCGAPRRPPRIVPRSATA